MISPTPLTAADPALLDSVNQTCRLNETIVTQDGVALALGAGFSRGISGGYWNDLRHTPSPEATGPKPLRPADKRQEPKSI